MTLALYCDPVLLWMRRRLLKQETFGLDGGFATAGGGGDGLPVVRVGHVACGKYAGELRARRAVEGPDVTHFVRFEPRFKDVGIRLVADGEEETVDGDVHLFLVRLTKAFHQVRALYAVFAKEPDGVVFEEHLDVRRLKDPFLHHLRGAQVGFADDEINLLREAGQVERFLARRVSAAHDRYALFAVEEPVARCAGRDAHARILRLVGQTKVFGRRAGADDQRLCFNCFLSVDRDLVGRGREVGSRCDAHADVGTEAFGLLFEVFHQLRTRHAFRIAGEVFDFGRGGQLSARLDSFVQNRGEVGTRGIDSRCISSWSGTDDEAADLFVCCCCHDVIVCKMLSQINDFSVRIVGFREGKEAVRLVRLGFPFADDDGIRRAVLIRDGERGGDVGELLDLQGDRLDIALPLGRQLDVVGRLGLARGARPDVFRLESVLVRAEEDGGVGELQLVAVWRGDVHLLGARQVSPLRRPVVPRGHVGCFEFEFIVAHVDEALEALRDTLLGNRRVEREMRLDTVRLRIHFGRFRQDFVCVLGKRGDREPADEEQYRVYNLFHLFPVLFEVIQELF